MSKTRHRLLSCWPAAISGRRIESRLRAYKPAVIVQNHGRGLVVGFAADPNFRAYLDGLNVLFLNAVFRGPARARPAVSY
jgi:hypothetical protein